MSKKRDRVRSASDEHRFHAPLEHEPSWFRRCNTVEEIEALCVRDYESSYAFYQQAIAEGVYTSADMHEAGTVETKRLFRARTFMAIQTRTPVEERWARQVIASYVDGVVSERLRVFAEPAIAKKGWAAVVLANEHAADPEQVIWAHHFTTNGKYF